MLNQEKNSKDFEAKRIELLTEYAAIVEVLSKSKENLHNSELYQNHQRLLSQHRQIRQKLSNLDRQQSKTL